MYGRLSSVHTFHTLAFWYKRSDISNSEAVSIANTSSPFLSNRTYIIMQLASALQMAPSLVSADWGEYIFQGGLYDFFFLVRASPLYLFTPRGILMSPRSPRPTKHTRCYHQRLEITLPTCHLSPQPPRLGTVSFFPDGKESKFNKLSW